jgi:hypothetical protein
MYWDSKMQVHFPPQNEATFSFTEGVDWSFAKGGGTVKEEVASYKELTPRSWEYLI